MPRWDVGEEPVAGYKLVDFLGRGGFGEVWLAEAPGGIQCALKIIDLISPDSAKELKALRLMKRLRHPHLCPITAFWIRDRRGNVLSLDELDLGKSGGGQLSELLISMGLGEKSLAKRLEEVNPLGTPAGSRKGIPSEELLRYIEGAAKGIDYLNQPDHKLGEGDAPIIHCDIKPGNLLVVADEAQVCDYGLARAITPDVRRVSMAGGTPAYSPPELLGNKPSLGTDQYSLAITYHELRTGCLPFPEDLSLAEIYRIHADDRLEFTHEVLTPRERDVLRRATRSRPADRFPNCRKFVDELKAAVFRAPTGVVSMGELSRERLFPPPPTPEPAPEPAPGTPVAIPPMSRSAPHITPRALITPRGSLLEELREGGKPVPGYTLAHMIATDPTGQTWQATDRADRLRVLRVILQPAAREHSGVTGLEAVQQIEHDHVARLYEFCFITNQCEPIPPETVGRGGMPPAGLVLVTEDVVRTVADRLSECQQQEGRLGVPEDELIRYLREVGLGLDALAGAQPSVLHLRLRPDVIGLTRHGSAKLLDAGVAPFIPASELRSAAAYAPPEVLDGTPSGRSDPYALALIYYKLRTGRLPFVETLDPARQRDLKKRGGFEWTLVGPTERDVLALATRPNPGERFATVRQLTDALAEAILPAPVAAARNEVAYTTPRSYRPPSDPDVPPFRPPSDPHIVLDRADPVPPSQRETSKPNDLYETPRRPEPVPPAYRGSITYPAAEEDEPGTLAPAPASGSVPPPAPRPSEPVAPWSKSNPELQPVERPLPPRSVRPFLPTPAAPETKSKTPIIVAAVAVGLAALGGIAYLVLKKPDTVSTSPTTPTTTTPPTTPPTVEPDSPWVKAEPDIARLTAEKKFVDAVTRIDDQSKAPSEWTKQQKDRVRAKWIEHLDPLQSDPLRTEVRTFLAKFPGDVWGLEKLRKYAIGKLVLPDLAKAKSRREVSDAVGTARREAEGYKADAGDSEWTGFESRLASAEKERVRELYRVARQAAVEAADAAEPDFTGAQAKWDEMKSLADAADQAEVDAVGQVLAAAKLERDPDAEKKVAALIPKLIESVKVEAVKAAALKKLDALGTRHVVVRKTIESGFPANGRPAELVPVFNRWKSDGLTRGLTAAVQKLDIAMGPRSNTAAAVRTAMDDVQTQLAQLPDDATFRTVRDDAKRRTETARCWLDSTAGTAGPVLEQLQKKDCPYPTPLLREAVRHFGDGKLDVASVRKEKAGRKSAIPADAFEEIETAYQSALAARAWNEMKSDRNPATLFEKTDHAFGWKALAEAETALGAPNSTPSDAARERALTALNEAKDFRPPGGAVRPAKAEFDELVKYLDWAANRGDEDDDARVADAAINLVGNSPVWTAARKARAAEALRGAARAVKPRPMVESQFLGPVYDRAKAVKARAWLDKANAWAGPGDTPAAALLYDAAGYSDLALKEAPNARGRLPEYHQRVRLGLLKIEAAKAARDSDAADRAAIDIAWDAVEWVNCEANRVGDKQDIWETTLQQAVRQVREKVLNGRPPSDVRIQAANARIEVLTRLFSIEGLKAKRDDALKAFQAAADVSTGPAKADYLAWKAFVRYLRLFDTASWADENEWRGMWADIAAAKAIDKSNGYAAYVSARVRFMGLNDYKPFERSPALFKLAKAVGTDRWGTDPDAWEFRQVMFDEMKVALAGLPHRPDANFRYFMAKALFNTSTRYDTARGRTEVADLLKTADRLAGEALRENYKFPDHTRYLLAQIHEDLAWIVEEDPTAALAQFQSAAEEYLGLTGPAAVADVSPAQVHLDLGRCRVRRALFAGGTWSGQEKQDLETARTAKGTNDEIKGEASYWLGRIAFAQGDWKTAEDLFTQSESGLAKYKDDRDVYRDLAKVQGNFTKLERKSPAITNEDKTARARALSDPATLFALGVNVTNIANRNYLAEALDNYPWRLAASDRAKLLLAVAEKSAGQLALKNRILKVVNRDAAVFGPDAVQKIMRALDP